MTSLLKMTWVETKLFLREPVTVLFTFALPLMILYVLGGVFGNEANPGGNGGLVVYGGYGPTNWFTPACCGFDDLTAITYSKSSFFIYKVNS